MSGNQLEKENQLSSYIREWVNARYPDWNNFYKSEYPYRRQGIYQLKDGDRLLDLLENIIGNIEDCLSVCNNEHLIPTKFSSVNQLLQFLYNFDILIKNDYHYVEQNICEDKTNYVVIKIIEICADISQMVSRCLEIYLDNDTIPIPYKQAKSSLINNDIQQFIDLIKSLIKSIPYNVRKEKVNESYFHTIFHVITSILGMMPLSEQEEQDCRLDMMFETPSRIFIFEFKYSEFSDESQTAINQIEKEQYDLAYHIRGKEIVGIGVSFSQSDRNVNGFLAKKLFSPHIYG